MTFEAYFGLEDPLYVFGASAQGVRFDLADKLKLLVPTLSPDEVYDADTATALNDYFTSLNRTYEGLVSSSDAVALSAGRVRAAGSPGSEPGETPDFEPGFESSPLDGLAVWANAELSDARTHLARDYTATVTAVAQQLREAAHRMVGKPLHTAAPDEEPAGLRSSRHGLRVVPWIEERPEDSIPRSGIVVLPTITQPASRTRAATGESTVFGSRLPAAVPIGDGSPRVWRFSFSVIGTPSIGEALAPARQRRSDSRAEDSASSRDTRYIALIRGSQASMRASTAAATSTGDKSRRA
jgi:hypothetical protein